MNLNIHIHLLALDGIPGWQTQELRVFEFLYSRDSRRHGPGHIARQ